MGSTVAELIDRNEAAAALRSYTGSLSSILRRSPQRDRRAIGAWTVGDVANHVAWGLENYTRWLENEDAPDLDAIENMADWNMRIVRGLPRPELSILADRIESTTDRFIDLLGQLPQSAVVPWYAGHAIPAEIALSMRLVEAAVHGRDIALAARERWEIRPHDARIISYGLGFIAPYFVHTTKLHFEGTMRVRIRGGSDLYYMVESGELRVEQSGPAPGWTLSADPVAWVLVMTGRKSQWPAALTGKIVGWGARPTLPFKLKAASFQG